MKEMLRITKKQIQHIMIMEVEVGMEVVLANHISAAQFHVSNVENKS